MTAPLPVRKVVAQWLIFLAASAAAEDAGISGPARIRPTPRQTCLTSHGGVTMPAAAAAAPGVDPVGLIGVGHGGPTARAGPLRPSFVIGDTDHFRFFRPHPYGRGTENQCR